MRVEHKTVPPVPTEPELEVTITLNKQEAEHLFVVVGGISGWVPVRSTTDALYFKLNEIVGDETGYKRFNELKGKFGIKAITVAKAD